MRVGKRRRLRGAGRQAGYGMGPPRPHHHVSVSRTCNPAMLRYLAVVWDASVLKLAFADEASLMDSMLPAAALQCCVAHIASPA